MKGRDTAGKLSGSKATAIARAKENNARIRFERCAKTICWTIRREPRKGDAAHDFLRGCHEGDATSSQPVAPSRSFSRSILRLGFRV
jgi:hypothetical protein